MQFLVVRNHGGGCDYTIGCGIDYYFINAESMEEALEQVKAEYTRIGNSDGESIMNPGQDERALKSIFLIPVSGKVDAPIDARHRDCYEAIEAEKVARTEVHERAQLAALQAKYP